MDTHSSKSFPLTEVPDKSSEEKKKANLQMTEHILCAYFFVEV